jgi:hypothetical protein
MYYQFEERFRRLLSSSPEKEREAIEDILRLLVENMETKDDIESIRKYLIERIKRRHRPTQKGDLSFLDVRNQLVHKGQPGESRVNILRYETLIWTILPRVSSFSDPNSLRNLLAYVMNRSISSELTFVERNTVVKEYRQLYKILPKHQKERVLFDLARRIFAEVSRTELEALIQDAG